MRHLGLAYGVICYAIFFVTFLYLIGFLANAYVPKAINSGVDGPIGTALLVNGILLAIFAVQHTLMARPGFKRAWVSIVPSSMERSTYVLLSSVALVVMYSHWLPMTDVIWDLSGTTPGLILLLLSLVGWAIVLSSSFMINHFDLFGLRQVYANFKQTTPTELKFTTRFYYRLVRHPIMTGFLIAFWATPTMTTGHFFFAVVNTIYVYIAVKHFEERDLIDAIGEDYVKYQKEVGPFFPGIGKG